MQFRMIVFENYLFQRDNFRYFLSFCAELCSVSLFSYFSSNLLNNIIKQSIPIYGDVCGTHRAKQLISRIWRARGSSNENWIDLIGWQLFKMLFGSSCVCVYVNVNVIGIEDAIIFAKTTQMPFFPQSSSPAVQQQQQSHQNSIQITHRFGKSAGKDTPHPLH